MTIALSGFLDDGAEPPCPVCGESLGYYAELGDNIECENCKSRMYIDRVQYLGYRIYRVRE